MWIKVSKISKSFNTKSWKDIDPKNKDSLSKFFYDNGMAQMNIVNAHSGIFLIGKFHSKNDMDRLDELKISLPEWQARKKYMEENNIISTIIYEGPEEGYDSSKYL